MFNIVSLEHDATDKVVVKQYYEAPSPNDFKDLKRKCSPFLLFRMKVKEAIQKSGRVRSASKISKIAAELWEETSQNEKEIYNRLSAALSRENVIWSSLQQQKTPIDKATEPEFFTYSKDVWTNEESELFGLTL
ncbi:2969_t:CDS:1 [Ambispora gerdemannii]|uniref:2969_t:CDS:1 n=1 Tax=Ambispora gerdemannii TaxID=144530 RepID=A0A9N9C9F2_9GLOM|nr:2969_t:CDS:1 [Ambispora gerdemannii]